MGGGAFAQAFAQDEPTLKIVRLGQKDYERLKQTYVNKLQTCFPKAKVGSLIEAPQKKDYGDIDLFVSTSETVNFINMANELGAAGVICHSPESSETIRICSVGVLKHGGVNNHPAVVYKHLDNPNNTSGSRSTAALTSEEYAQIDIEIVSPELLEWHKFYSSYGDMVGLLGHIVHNLGFTVSDRGFWLRMKEVSDAKAVKHVNNVAHRDGMILLSKDPEKVMEFLNLSVDTYYAGFSTLNELYSWLGTCRLLSADAIKIKRNNAHERNRERKRIVFANFFDEWLPEHMDMSEQDESMRNERVLKLRQDLVQDAVTFFGKQSDYELKHTALVRTIHNANAVDLLKPIIAKHSLKEGKKLNEIVRAFKRYVVFGEENSGASGPQIDKTPHTDAASQLYRFLDAEGTSFRDSNAVSEWVCEHWGELKALERHKSKD